LTKPLPETDFVKLKERIMGKEKGYVCSNLKGSVEINESRIPVAKDKGILGSGSKKRQGSRLEQTAPHQMQTHARKAQPQVGKSKRRQCCRKGTVKDTTPNEELHRTLGLGE